MAILGWVAAAVGLVSLYRRELRALLAGGKLPEPVTERRVNDAERVRGILYGTLVFVVVAAVGMAVWDAFTGDTDQATLLVALATCAVVSLFGGSAMRRTGGRSGLGRQSRPSVSRR